MSSRADTPELGAQAAAEPAAESDDLRASLNNPHRLVTAIGNQRPVLELSTLDIAFVVALHTHASDAQLPAFSEQQLLDVYTSVCRIIEPTAENLKQRCTYAISRLRSQRLLARVDGHGVVRQGEFTLTRLASAIADFYVQDEALNQESLSVLTAALAHVLDDVVQAAQRVTSDDDWRKFVIGPLGVSITELVAGIERRQRGLDLQQEQFQLELRELLEADWFGAIDRCQTLLESTASTLRELGEMLLRDSAKLIDMLQTVVESAQAANANAAEQTALKVIEQIDRIAAWGAARQRAWSEYFQYVHRYLRDVVRLDPSRALTQRLREQIANGTKYSLTLAAAPSMQVLRTVSAVKILPPVKRARAQREKPPVADDSADLEQQLTDRVASALGQGAETLAKVTTLVNAEVEPAEHYAMTGRVAHRVVELARAQSAHERTWTATSDVIEIEDWAIQPKDAT